MEDKQKAKFPYIPVKSEIEELKFQVENSVKRPSERSYESYLTKQFSVNAQIPRRETVQPVIQTIKPLTNISNVNQVDQGRIGTTVQRTIGNPVKKEQMTGKSR